jgi:hypothetical protein
MSILGAAVQQPIDILDYDIGYDDFLNVNFDNVASVSVNLVPDTTTVNVNAWVSGPDTVKVWIQGGVHGDNVTAEITAVTVAGRTKQDEIMVIIEDFK